MTYDVETPSESSATQGATGGGPQTFDFSNWAHLVETHPLPSTPRLQDTDPYYPNPLERMVALVFLIVLSPVMLLVALAIKIESPGGPVFFRQARVGLNRRHARHATRTADPGVPGAGVDRRRTAGQGQVFLMWKFRTMIPNAEARTGAVWASAKDPRVTRVGHILRHLRLDEVPQFLNVFQGNMRLIGPRPERPEFVRVLIEDMPDYAHRLKVPPGITGLAQVEREYDSNVDDVRRKLGYDLFYVKNRCWLLDLKILVKTVDVVVRGRGAH